MIMTKHLRILLALILLMAVSVAKASWYNKYYVVDNIRYAVNTDYNIAKVVADDAYKDMTEITIPATITEDGVTYRVTKLEGFCFDGCTKLKSITIPNSVTNLGGYCFRCCTSLTSVTIPNSVTELGRECFWGCTSLTSITIPNSVTSLGEHCFSDCTSLTSVTIPNSVTSLGDYCFFGCTSLTSIIIPNSVTTIGKYCFWNCTNLSTVNLPNSITDLTRVFYHCTGLKSISIPASVKSLSSYYYSDDYSVDGCFEGCTSLNNVLIPNSVTSLGGECFAGCKSLKEVTCLAETPPYIPIGYSSFEDEAQKTLYVPEASVEAYRTSIDWRNFGKILPLSASGIKAVKKGDIGMNLENGTLTLSNVPSGEPVSVYSTTGQLLGTGKGNISVNAQGAQMVIVKVCGKSYKMLAK